MQFLRSPANRPVLPNFSKKLTWGRQWWSINTSGKIYIGYGCLLLETFVFPTHPFAYNAYWKSNVISSTGNLNKALKMSKNENGFCHCIGREPWWGLGMDASTTANSKVVPTKARSMQAIMMESGGIAEVCTTTGVYCWSGKAAGEFFGKLYNSFCWGSFFSFGQMKLEFSAVSLAGCGTTFSSCSGSSSSPVFLPGSSCILHSFPLSFAVHLVR